MTNPDFYETTEEERLAKVCYLQDLVFRREVLNEDLPESLDTAWAELWQSTKESYITAVKDRLEKRRAGIVHCADYLTIHDRLFNSTVDIIADSL